MHKSMALTHFRSLITYGQSQSGNKCPGPTVTYTTREVITLLQVDVQDVSGPASGADGADGSSETPAPISTDGLLHGHHHNAANGTFFNLSIPKM